VPSFPSGRFVKVRAVRVNKNGTIDILRSPNPAPRKRKNARSPSNGYVVYPSGDQVFSSAKAKAIAKRQSKQDGRTRVEHVDSGRVVARFEYGQKVSNPAKKRANSKRKLKVGSRAWVEKMARARKRAARKRR